MCRAIATNPTVNRVRTTVATRNPAGAPSPLPEPIAIGTLPVIAVIGAALATAMKSTPTKPSAPALSLPPLPGAGPGPAAVPGAGPVVVPGAVRVPAPAVDRSSAVTADSSQPVE